ncbi:MAG: ABC transporter permease [Hyphomicrobiaceae bacterium]
MPRSSAYRAWVAARPVVLPALTLGALIALWEACVRGFAIPEFLLPAPSAIFSAVVQQAPNVLQHTRSTMFTILAGFAASIIVGFPLAIAIASSPLLANALYPLLVLTQSVPKIAIAPLLVIVFGANEVPRIIVTFLVAFFPLVISVAAGLLATPPELVELGRALRASWSQELFRIRLPSATPFVFSGLKMAITFSVIGAVVGEFVAADRGLGYLITSSAAFFKTPLAFGAIVLLSIIGIVLFQIIVIIERAFFSWSVTDSRGL